MKDYEERRMEKAYIGCGMTMAWAMVVLFIFLLMTLSSCRSIKYVPVVEHHTETIVQRDSVFSRDTIIDHSQVVVREVDSATMSKYGIQLKDMQRAWLIERNRLQKQVSELMHSHADTLVIRDTIPQPIPVTVEVEKRLSWWQQTRLQFANIVMLLMIGALAWWIIKRKVIP